LQARHFIVILTRYLIILDMSTPKKSAESKIIDFNAVFQAVKCYVEEQKSIRSTAREYGLDKSTLQRYVRKAKAEYEDILSVEKDELMEFIRMCNKKTPSNMVCFFLFIRTFLYGDFFPTQISANKIT